MLKQTEPLKKWQFYSIYDDNDEYEYFVLEDRIKRGLSRVENTIDKDVGVLAEKWCIHDGNGRGYVVPINWFFPKRKYIFETVCYFADKLDNRYTSIMEDTLSRLLMAVLILILIKYLI